MITNFPDVHFSTLRDELGLALGVDAEDGQITNQFARQCARALNAATRYAWQVYSWPEVCPVLTALEVDAGGGRMVPVVAPGYELLRVYSENPDTAYAETEDTRAKEIPFSLGRRGNVVLSETVTTPYYLVRLAPPVFGAEAWSAAVDYQPGAVVFDAGGDNSAGDCYAAMRGSLNSALPTTWEPWRESAALVSGDKYFVHGVLWEANDGSATVEDTMEPGVGSLWLSYFEPEHLAWAPQRLPRFLKEAVLAGAEAWLQRTLEGQVASMAVVRKVMDEHLASEVASRWATRRQHRNGLPLHLS